MPFWMLYFFCCLGISVCVVGMIYGIVRLFSKATLKVRRNRHWKRCKKAEVWLGQWGA